MPRLVAIAFGLLLIPTVGLAQKPAEKAPAEAAQSATTLPPMVAPYTPNMDMGRYVNSRDLVRQNAAWKAEQRRQRMAAMAWLGYSPLRPPASPVPTMGTYSGLIGIGSYTPFPTFYHPGGPLVIGQAETPVSR